MVTENLCSGKYDLTGAHIKTYGYVISQKNQFDLRPNHKHIRSKKSVIINVTKHHKTNYVFVAKTRFPTTISDLHYFFLVQIQLELYLVNVGNWQEICNVTVPAIIVT